MQDAKTNMLDFRFFCLFYIVHFLLELTNATIA
jgi:hypothetical protein